MDIVQGVASRSFTGTSGGSEHFITIKDAPPELSLAEQIGYVEERYAVARESLGLGPDSAIFRRVFLSDVLNQKEFVRESSLLGEDCDAPVAVSIVQQAPLPGAKIALQAYHIEGQAPIRKFRLTGHDLLVEKNGRRHLWTTGLCAGAEVASGSPGVQTRAIFDDLIATISDQGGTLAEHCVRTWVYLKDVDVFYQDMVKSRGTLFDEQGLTAETHYIASTGIEGACGHQFDLVAMDAYSALDLTPEQMSYLNDLDRLCATKDYGVTFERGTRIAYADRAHHFISGTASIDKEGKIVHPGDVIGQLAHALDNVDALLHAGSAGLADMMGLTVYLRDPTDFAGVDERLRDHLPDLPFVIVQGAVCRPGWLVEVEGVAIAPNDEPSFPAF